jgi:4-hydroxybenzoyl-CoA thioesterase
MFVNRRDVRIEWGDCDPAGIVFYPRYFAMFDASTAALLAAALALDKREMLKEFGIVGFPMVDTRAQFHLPCRFCDVVTIESRIPRIGDSSFEVEHQLTRDGTIAVECFEKRVWAIRNPEKPEQFRGIPVPQVLRDALLQQNTSVGERSGLY